MNVDLPGEESVLEFWLIMALLVTIFGGLLFFFRRMRWL
jgi:Mg2+ and Co2+ transporter CorA